MNNMDKLRAKIDLQGSCALITSPVNRRYFTGFNASDGMLLIFESDAYFLTDSRYTEAAKREVTGAEVILIEKSDEQVNALLMKHKAAEMLIEADKVTVAELRNFDKKIRSVTIDSSDKLRKAIRSLRMIKTPAEIEAMKKAQKFAHDALAELLSEPFTPGFTEKKLSAKLEFLMKSGGADDISFETIALFGAHSSMPHGVPGEAAIKPGDALLLDFGAVSGGYHSDMTRTMFLNHVSDEEKTIWEIVLEARQCALAAIKPGVPCLEVDKAARDYITAAGYGEYFGHGLGHSVGLEIHEYPACNKTCKEELLPGMIMTVEPGIYIPGQIGVRIEDMVVVTENGYKNLTQTPIELIKNVKFS
jgi:Xaa-Pro aminopeptidase